MGDDYDSISELLFWAFIACAIAVCLNLLSGCGTVGPNVAICISDPPRGGAQCKPAKSGPDYFLSYPQTTNFVMMSPDDAKLLFQWVELNCKKKDP